MGNKKSYVEEIKNLFEEIFHVKVNDFNQSLLDVEYKLPTADYLYFLQELKHRYGAQFVRGILDKGWNEFTVQNIAEQMADK